MIRTSLLPLLTAVGLLFGSSAAADTVTADRDAGLRANNDGPYGKEIYWRVTNHSRAKKTWKGLVSFPTRTNSAVEASLTLTVAENEPSSTSTFNVFGVRDGLTAWEEGALCITEGFDESVVKYDHVPFFDGSGDGVKNESPCLFEGNILGRFTIQPGSIGQQVTFSSPALLRFLRENRNGRVTFLLTRLDSDSGEGFTAFASHEHPTLAAPTFTWTDSGELNLPDYETGAVVSEGGRTVDYQGRLALPVANGQTIEFPNANVRMTFGADNRLTGLHGTVGYPTLPMVGLFGAVGGVTGSAPFLEIGWGLPSTFNDVGLPLNEHVKYYYLRAVTGASLAYGPFSVESPDAGETLLVLDTVQPAFLFYTSHMPGSVPLDSVRVGVSGTHSIPWQPEVTWRVGDRMTRFSGDYYFGASGALPVIPGVDVEVDGDLVAQVVDQNFPDGNWLRHLGGNADVSLAASAGIFNFSLPTARASLRYDSQGAGGQATLVYSAKDVIPDLKGVPVKLKANTRAAVYLPKSNFVNDAYAEFEGELEFTAVWKQRVSGRVRLEDQHGTLDLKVNFGGTQMGALGTIGPDYARFKGELSQNWDFEVGKVKAGTSVTFDTRNPAPTFTPWAKFCIDGLGCDPVKDALEFAEDGGLKICAYVPVYGKTCRKL